MSDTEVEASPAVDTSVAGPSDIFAALREVLKSALIANGLIRGLNQCVKVLDKRRALLCVLSTSCDEAQYTKLVEALCKEHKIPLMKVDDSKKLGEWSGLCKIDKEGEARKVVGSSIVVITDYGKESPAHDVLQDYLKANK